MAAHKKKIVAFLIAAALGSIVLWICAAGSTSAEPTKPLFDNSSLSFSKDPNLFTKEYHSPSIGNLFFRAVLAVLLVVVFGVAAIYISKKFLPRITNLAGKKIQVIETVHLGPRKSVHLLKIGNRQLLIGSTSESITRLADVTDGFTEMDMSAAEIDNI